MRTSARSLLALIAFLCVDHALSVQYCAVNNFLIQSKETMEQHTTATWSNTGDCKIAFYKCGFEVDTYGDEHEEGCIFTGENIQCRCKQRFCNMNMNFFFEKAKKVAASTDQGLDIMGENCQQWPIHSITVPTQDTIKCVQGSEGGKVIFYDGNEWKSVDDVDSSEESGFCTISFNANDCSLSLYNPVAVLEERKSLAAIDMCVHIGNNEVICSCIHDDFCNADISGWAEKARQASVDMSACKWEGFPDYKSILMARTTEEPTTEEPTTEEPTTEEPSTEEPTTEEESTSKHPTTEENASKSSESSSTSKTTRKSNVPNATTVAQTPEEYAAPQGPENISTRSIYLFSFLILVLRI